MLPTYSNLRKNKKNEKNRRKSQGYLNLYPINSDIRCQISKEWEEGPVGANELLNDSEFARICGVWKWVSDSHIWWWHHDWKYSNAKLIHAFFIWNSGFSLLFPNRNLSICNHALSLSLSLSITISPNSISNFWTDKSRNVSYKKQMATSRHCTGQSKILLYMFFHISYWPTQLCTWIKVKGNTFDYYYHTQIRTNPR